MKQFLTSSENKEFTLQSIAGRQLKIHRIYRLAIHVYCIIPNEFSGHFVRFG